ncbi:glycosyltransferase family 2 protein [Enteractinococcus helveticum]|uniref:Glycosyltransferase 2-like domain-containing protein n=1 Tax=Enteractinococcus helveticum TaxID=1837282 RepID=A0A1B7LUP5_9MICC|nr:glycosyltransferase family A protein [Enteractinococcus helveticum]OAV51190.1 hypothetical protein A6F49_02035 [Enteractinococcus helveticum]
MSQEYGWLRRQRIKLWHLRKGNLKGYRNKQAALKAGVGSAETTTHPVFPVPTTIQDIEVPVLATLVVTPAHMPHLKDALDSIYWQVETIYVYLIGFTSVPNILKRPHIQIIRSEVDSALLSEGCSFLLPRVDEGIVFPINGWICYPPDYVSKMLTQLKSTEFKSVVGAEGLFLPRYPKDAIDGHSFSLTSKVKFLTFASMLHSATMAFDVSILPKSFSQSHAIVSDATFASFLKSNNIVCFVVPHGSHWLTSLLADEEHSKHYSDLGPETREIREAAPWGEEDALRRLESFPNHEILDASLVQALGVLRQAEGSRAEALHQYDEKRLASILRWLDIYADPATREGIILELLRSNVTPMLGRQLLTRLWKLNKAAAISFSRVFIQEKVDTSEAIRLHANFCAGLYYSVEADKYYLHAIRVSGALGDGKTTDILFEYFLFLTRNHKYERAAVIGSSLKISHSEDAFFQACMVLICLNDTDQKENLGAGKWLTALFSNEDTVNRSAAVNRLVRALAETAPLYTSRVTPLVETADLQLSLIQVELLVSLLKIVTVVNDESGAQLIWDAINNSHKSYLADHPEIVSYFKTNWLRAKSEPRDYEGHHRVLSTVGEHEPRNDDPLVSVILTAYNSEDTISMAMQSILNQSYRNFELIVVDDYSTDGTALIAETWARKHTRLKVIRNSENMGPYRSRNIALQSASGAFIAIQDADDVSLPDRLRVQVDSLDTRTQAVIGQHIRVSHDGAIQLENDGSILGHGPVSLLVRSSAVEEIGAFAEVRTRGDKEFESRMEHYYGSTGLKRICKVLVHALDDTKTNSKTQTATDDKKRELLLFKENYLRKHAQWIFKSA